MPFSPKTLEEKPYNLCLNCTHIGKRCDGPNFLAMELPRLSEWGRLRKEYLHSIDPKWTNAYVADQAKVSKNTVDRFFAGALDDIKLSTLCSIMKVLVNGTWGQYPCVLGESEVVYVDNPVLVEKCCRLETDLETTRADYQRKVDHLKEQIRFNEKLIDKLLEK